MNKRELIEKIAHEHTIHKGYAQIIVNAIDVEGWLHHPDRAPGRTITESELEEAKRFAKHHGIRPMLHRHFGLTVVPDPKPTNAGRLAEVLRSSFNDSKFDLETSFEDMARALDAAGVKAPGGDEPEAEHNRDWWIENANVNDAEDCEACIDDLCPVHHGIALGIEFVTKKIAALGDDPELFNSIPNPSKTGGGDE